MFQVQPGQSKTIAYKQVSYQYNKTLDGKPIGKISLLSSLNRNQARLPPPLQDVSFKSIEREKIFSTFLAFALDLRFQIRERIPISTIFRRHAFEFFAETGRFRNEIRKKAKTVWIKSFLPDMLHQLRTLGRVREESRASAFKRMVGRKGGSGHSRVAPFKAWNGLAGIRLINNENEKTRE